jgi:FkbM family methyltransferase
MSIDNKAVMLEYLKYCSPKKGDVVIDAGSFYGIFSLYCSRKIGPAGKVIAFEIDPINLKILRKNLMLNKIPEKGGASPNIVLVQKGLWNRREKSRISIGGSGSAISKNSLVDVELEKGDDIIKKLKLKRLDLIKMNIEGAEIQALRGLKRTIMRFKPKIIVWANHSYNGEITDKKVKALLKGLNYNLKTTKDLIVIAEPKK